MREHPNGWQWEALDFPNKVEISLCEPAQQQRATADSSADQNLRGTALTHSKGLAMINYVYLGGMLEQQQERATLPLPFPTDLSFS